LYIYHTTENTHEISRSSYIWLIIKFIHKLRLRL
jgi:hypothetical protein